MITRLPSTTEVCQWTRQLSRGLAQQAGTICVYEHYKLGDTCPPVGIHPAGPFTDAVHVPMNVLADDEYQDDLDLQAIAEIFNEEIARRALLRFAIPPRVRVGDMGEYQACYAHRGVPVRGVAYLLPTTFKPRVRFDILGGRS